MFKKQLIVVGIFGLLCALLIGYSAISVTTSASSFSGSGYVHVSSLESEEKRIAFDSGTSYKKKAGDTITFSDVLGDSSSVDAKNFIHYDDSSLASFTNGVLVDLEELSDTSAINHYAISPDVTLQYSGSAYTVANADATSQYNFKEFIWKIDENKYLCVSPTMKLRVSNEDERNISNYAEITYLGDKLIQIQTEENVWQTISDECHLITAAGHDIDLSLKNVSSNQGDVLLDFSRIVINSEDNVETTPLSQGVNSMKETVIPHFSITAENGAAGLSGTPGESGETGGPGQPGENGASGLSGTDGIAGGQGGEGQPGESEELEGDIYDFPVFTVSDWEVHATSCNGSIIVTDNKSMLQNDSAAEYTNADFYGLYLVDMATGETIYQSDSGIEKKGNAWEFYSHITTDPTDPQKILFHFEGLIPDHTYMLHANALTQIDLQSESYIRSYVSKTFWTDSVGIYMEPSAATTNTVGFNVVKQNTASSDFYVYYKVFNSLEEASKVNVYDSSSYDAKLWDPYKANASTAWDWLNGDGSPSTYKYWPCVYPNTSSDYEGSSVELSHNTKVYVRLAFSYSQPLSASKLYFDDISSQILELSTLKMRAHISSPILSVNRSAWGFDITTGTVSDPDGGIEKYTYEFYTLDSFVKNGDDYTDELKPGATPSKVLVRYDSNNTSISLDEVQLKSMTTYRCRTIASFNDNEKTYNIESGFSNTVYLEGSIRPSVYFSALISEASGETIDGTYVQLPFYDNAYGYIYINPGANGSRLMLNTNSTGIYNHPIVRVTKDGYYQDEFVVYDKNDTSAPTTIGTRVLKAETLSDGRVKIYLPDKLAVADSPVDQPTVAGLQPNSRYDIEVVGDLSDDGINISEVMADIGRCQIQTIGEATFNATWTSAKVPDALKEANIKLAPADLNQDDQFNRQKKALTQITFTLYGREFATDADLAKAKAADIEGTPLTLSRRNADGTLNVEDSELIDKMFSSDGLTLTSDMFSNDPNFSDDVQKKCPKLTVAVSKAYDYTCIAANRTPQEKYKSTAKSDKNYVVGNNNYYINEFDILNTRITLSSSRDIGAITGKDFDTIQGVDDDGIVAKAKYVNNSTLDNGSITYYVFDAVDFYAGSKIVGKTTDTYGFTTYEYNGKTYNVNPEIKSWVENPNNQYSSVDRPCYAMKYETPVHLDGLALGTVTIPVYEGQNTPSMVFYPMSRANYIAKIGRTVGSTDESGNYYLFYDEAHASEPERGHQFVIAYTVNVHSEDENCRYVYPFDSFVHDSSLPDDQAVFYENFATDEKATEKIVGSALASCDYTFDNSNAVFGHDGYMLIPHTTLKSAPKTDRPKYVPNTYSLQWDSNYVGTSNVPNKTDSTVTMRTSVADIDNSVYKQLKSGSSNEYETDIYIYQDVIAGSSPSYYNLTSNSYTGKVAVINGEINESTMTKSLLGYGSSGSFVPYKFAEVTLKEGEMANLEGANLKNNREVITMVPIQRYTNKYTDFYYTKPESEPRELHITGNEYTVGSLDGNYRFITPSDEKAKEKYQELFETKYYDVFDYHGDNGSGSFSVDRTTIPGTVEASNKIGTGMEMKAYFRWLMNNGVKEAGQIQVIGKEDLMKNIQGFRITFESYSKTDLDLYYNNPSVMDTRPRYSFYVDKFLPSDSFVDVSGDIDSQISVKDLGNGYYLANFRFLVANEASNGGTDFDNCYRSYDFSNINSNTYNEEYGKVDIKVTALFAGNRYGYSGIGTSFSGNTYGFTSVKRNNAAPYINEDLYKFGNLQSYGFSAATGSSNFGVINNALVPKNGGFFRIRKSDSKLNIMSTRHWQWGSASTNTNYFADVSIGTRTSTTQTMYMPVNIVESGKINLYDYTTNKWDVPVNSIEMPESPPVISYNIPTIYPTSTTINYKINAADPNMYFTISDTLTPPDANGKAKYYSVTNSGSLTNQVATISNNTTELTIPGTSQATSTTPPADDPYKDYMIPVTGSTLNFALKGLEHNHPYTIVCWRWCVLSQVGGVDYYGYKRIDMSNDETGTTPNYLLLTTKKLPDATLDKTNIYETYEMDEKYVRVKLNMEEWNSGSGGSGGNYQLIELYEKQDDGSYNFLTYLYVGRAGANSDIFFDIDGDCNGETIVHSSKFHAYLLDRGSGINPSTHALNIEPSTPKLALEYGKTYQLLSRIYNEGSGPAYTASYNYGIDADNVLIDSKHSYGYDKIPTAEFTVIKEWDYMSALQSSVLVRDGSDSYMTFNIQPLNLHAGSLKGNVVAPVLIWKHYTTAPTYDITGNMLDPGVWEFYDISSELEVESLGKKLGDPDINGLVSVIGGQRLRFAFSEDTDSDTQYELKKINVNGTQIDLLVDDEIYCYIYAYQGAELQLDPSGSAGIVVGDILGSNDALEPQLLLGTRFTPNYTSAQKILDHDILSKLSNKDCTTEYPHSRLMGSAERNVANVAVSAGKVSITMIEMAHTATVTLTDAVAPTAIRAYYYSMKARTYRDDGASIVWNTRTIPFKSDSIDLSTSTDPYGIAIDIGAITRSLVTGEKIHSWDVTIYFTSTEKDASPQKVVLIDAASASGSQSVSIEGAGNKLRLFTVKDDGRTDPGEPVTTSSYKPNLITNLLNKLFKTGGEDGAK